MSRDPGKVFLVGAGPGDPGLLTLRAADVLRNADVLLYDALASDPTLTLVSPRCECIFVGKRGGNHALPQDEIEALIVRKAREGKRVVRLKGGDPFVFGRGAEEAQELKAAGIPFEIIPGISSAIAAPAYAGIPVTHRDHNTAFTVATGHEDPTKPGSTLDWSRLADPHRTLVLLMAMGNLAAIADKLIGHGLSPATPAAIVQDGTRPTQRSVVGTLATIAGDARREGLHAPAIVIVGDVVSVREQVAWFDTGPLFGKRVLVTRPAHQSERFAQTLYSRGIEPILAPAIEIGPPDDTHAAHRLIDDIGTYRWIVFTSQNGVDAFFERVRSLGADARLLGNVRIAAIGSKTAERLVRYGLHADLVPSAFISEEIARGLIEATNEGERIAVYRAQEARDVLPQMLRDAGRDVTVVAAYKTSFVHDQDYAEKVERADILTFTSASTVLAFAALLGGDAAAVRAAHGKTIACIGPITADAVRQVGLQPDIVADVFTTDGLLDALEDHVASRSTA
ncbi:MAG: uroporphyrinogen-III C-methyltransferase [Vulcanimicrobiaceae bacterium]